MIARLSTVTIITAAIFSRAFGTEHAMERGLIIVTGGWYRGSTLLVIGYSLGVIYSTTAKAGQRIELWLGL